MPAHEPYQLFPDVSPDDHEALREEIRFRGVQVPVKFDEDRHILDGHQRWHFCQDLDLECPSLVREGLTDEQKLEHVLQLNLSRRHLTRDALG
jgi:ParB-like chromosome segregation protein Spo0J